MKGLTLLILS